jgi:hypothetical protein
MIRIVVPLLLIVGLAACGDDNDVGEPEDIAAFTLRERIVTVDDAVVVWENADTIGEAHAAAEAAANLVVGSGDPDYGDRDGNGTVDGDTEFGVLPGLDGSPVGLASALENNECVVADVLGGTWDDPGARWAELDTAIAEWADDNNTIQGLASHPMRIVGWASLALASDDLAEATGYGGRSQLHIDVSLSAIDCDS